MKFKYLFAEERSYDRYVKSYGVEHDIRFTKQEVYDVLYPYADRDDIFVSFRDSMDHTNINIKNKYDTPHGFYCYPVKDLFKNYKSAIENVIDIPFGSDRDFMFIIKPKSGSTGLIIKNYGLVEYEKDIKKIESNFGMNKADIREAAQNARRDLYASQLWNVTRIFSEKNPIKWNAVLRKLGYDYVVDNGKSVIHHNEPHQAVFLTSSSFEIIDIIKNYSKKGSSDDRIRGSIREGNIQKFDLFFKKYYSVNNLAVVARAMAIAIILNKQNIVNFIASEYTKPTKIFFTYVLENINYFFDAKSDHKSIINFIKDYGNKHIENFKDDVFYTMIVNAPIKMFFDKSYFIFIDELIDKIFNNDLSHYVNKNNFAKFFEQMVNNQGFDFVMRVLKRSHVDNEIVLMKSIDVLVKKFYNEGYDTAKAANRSIDILIKNSSVKISKNFVKTFLEEYGYNDYILEYFINKPDIFGIDFIDNRIISSMLDSKWRPDDKKNLIRKFIYGDDFKNHDLKINIKHVISMIVDSFKYYGAPGDIPDFVLKLYMDNKIIRDSDNEKIGNVFIKASGIFDNIKIDDIITYAIKIGDVDYSARYVRDILKMNIDNFKEVEHIISKELEKHE